MEYLSGMLIVYVLNGVKFCSSDICLTWCISDNLLRFTCTTDNLYHSVTFHDPTGEEQAGCIVSYPEPPVCFKHHMYENGNVTQNVLKKETIFTIRREIDQNVLGIWTCHHGNEVASVELTSKPVTDLTTPHIKSNQSLPFLSGTGVEIICTTEINKNTVEIKWDCLHGDVIEEHIDNCSTYTSKLVLKVTKLNDGKLCTCTAKANAVEMSAFINFDVREQPTLELPDHMICNESSNISIKCLAHGYPAWYRFATWIHTYENTYFRHITGIDEGNISTIHIQSCSFEDMGNYTCRIIITKFEDMLIQKSTPVQVRGSPFIVKTLTNVKKHITLSAIFLSFPSPYTPKWYTTNGLISNSSTFIQQTSSELIILQMYGKPVVLGGYVASLSVQNDLPFIDTVMLVLQNRYGNKSHDFPFAKDQHAFHIRMLLWVLVVISVVILTVVVTTCLATKLSRKHMRRAVSPARQIYFGAPADNIPHMYDPVTSHYDDIDETNPYLDVISSVSEQDKDPLEEDNSNHYIDVI